MPAVAAGLLQHLTARAASTSAANTPDIGIQVVCAWPVSGQYGPGSRILYYVLVAACILARKAEWIRNACLAGALLVPVVAALHGIVLASQHNPDAVDMDVYGAFQFCAIGALVAPVTVRASKTYGSNPGRNAIFLWAIVVLAGLISLTVEFYRTQTKSCTHDDSNPPRAISTNIGLFPYGNAQCGLVCTEEDPVSPLRGGSATNIYVIPAPSKFAFGAATLVSAACCIPAILLLVSMWINILEINWRKIFGQDESVGEVNNNKITKAIRKYAMIIIFGGAVFAVLVIGELNLWSAQVKYQTEPIANVGQWTPIAGTAIAVLGSLYLLLAEATAQERAAMAAPPFGPEREKPREGFGIIAYTARALIKVSDHVWQPRHDRFMVSDFRRGSAMHYPEVPGENLRNRALSRTRSTYSRRRSSNESLSSNISRQRSGTIESVAPDVAVDDANQATKPRESKRRDTLEVPNSPKPKPRTFTSGSLPAFAEPESYVNLDGDSEAQATAGAQDFIARTETLDAPGIVVSPGSRRASVAEGSDHE